MHELPTATLHFDPPFPGLIGGTIVQGWLVPKAGRHYTDVRIVAGGGVFPGVHGIPRPDLAAFFKSDRPFLLAGFSITLTLPAGRHRLGFEACSLTGSWEPLETLERDVTADEARPDPEIRIPLDAAAVGETLQVLLRRGVASGLSSEAAALIDATPPRHHLQHPPRPFHGHLDQPQVWSRSVFGRLAITGWVFHERLPIKRVFATTDLLAVQELKYGRETPFLPARPGAPAHSAQAGYDGFLDLPAQLPLPVSVRVYAELADGSWHLGSVARFTATDHEFAKRPFASFSPLTFGRAWRALERAIDARGWPLPTGEAYRKVIHQVWRKYSTEAPRRNLGEPAAIAAPKRPAGAGSPGLVHFITHNLNHEGAPLFLLELARQVRLETGLVLAVTSGREGPLRAGFEALGAQVQVVDSSLLLEVDSANALHEALETLGDHVDLTKASLVVANTLSAWWGIHLARRAGRPALFYIHESTPPRCFLHGHIRSPAVLAAVEEAFRLADRVSFLTASTRGYFTNLSDQSNYCLNPGWIDLAGIDQFRAAWPRETLRAPLGLSPGQKLVINVGTVCERKGQHHFARAVDLLWQNAPDLAASAMFMMIGGRDTPYDRDLAAFLTGLKRPNLRIIPETGEVYPYYGAADLFACSSYEESFPRVILEAMGFGLPIVSTDVHGIPEMVRPDHEALLVPPGDSAALAGALQRLLGSPATGQALAQRARARVAAEFASQVILPRHLALLRSLLPGTG